MVTFTFTASSSVVQPRSSTLKNQYGFSLIELLVTIAVLGIILALGIPNLNQFLIRNQTSSIASEFASDVARTRIEAISRNGCATMCMSSNTSNALTGGTPTCATTGSNLQAGWIIFSNPSCSGTQNNPTTNGSTLIAVRQKGPDTFELSPASGAALRRLTFDSRGLGQAIQRNLTLAYVPETTSSPNYRSLCISSAGRVTVKEYGGTSACP